MSEKPILFSAPMVKAILDGRKTQTRRVLKPQPAGEVYWNSLLAEWRWMASDGSDDEVNDPVVIPYAPGDLLWVREAFAVHEGGPIYDAAGGQMDSVETEIVYRATDPNGASRWKPSIYMPRTLSRITLRVTAVKVERLQEISEDDVRAEGVEFEGERGFRGPPLELFSSLWDSINGDGAWDANPWVAAYSFERVKP